MKWGLLLLVAHFSIFFAVFPFERMMSLHALNVAPLILWKRLFAMSQQNYWNWVLVAPASILCKLVWHLQWQQCWSSRILIWICRCLMLCTDVRVSANRANFDASVTVSSEQPMANNPYFMFAGPSIIFNGTNIWFSSFWHYSPYFGKCFHIKENFSIY